MILEKATREDSLPVAKLFTRYVNQEIDRMAKDVIYPHPKNFMGRLAIQTCRDHLCSYYESLTRCVYTGVRVDPVSGHDVCCGCGKITARSGLRTCDTCEREYIDKTKYQDDSYETYCPECVEEFGLDG